MQVTLLPGRCCRLARKAFKHWAQRTNERANRLMSFISGVRQGVTIVKRTNSKRHRPFKEPPPSQSAYTSSQTRLILLRNGMAHRSLAGHFSLLACDKVNLHLQGICQNYNIKSSWEWPVPMVPAEILMYNGGYWTRDQRTWWPVCSEVKLANFGKIKLLLCDLYHKQQHRS